MSSSQKNPIKVSCLKSPSLSTKYQNHRAYSTDKNFLKSFIAFGIISSILISKAECKTQKNLINSSPLASQLPNKAPPTSKEFVKAVREFESLMKLENFLTGNISDLSSEKAQIREAFFSHEVIQCYLARSSKFIDFLENRPALSMNKKKPLTVTTTNVGFMN